MGVGFGKAVHSLGITKLSIKRAGTIKISGLGVEMNAAKHASMITGNLKRSFRRRGNGQTVNQN
jgi:hypothetical protein